MKRHRPFTRDIMKARFKCDQCKSEFGGFAITLRSIKYKSVPEHLPPGLHYTVERDCRFIRLNRMEDVHGTDRVPVCPRCDCVSFFGFEQVIRTDI